MYLRASIFIYWGILLLFPNFASSQSFKELGRPFYTYYSPSDYNANGQNWAAVQDSSGRMFFANNHGVLRFDGHRWHKAPSLNGGLIRALVKDDENNLYWGGQNDFGVVSSDSAGNTVLESLTHLIPDSVESYNNVWNILINEHGVYYRSNKYIFRYYNGSISIIKNDRWFQHGFAIKGKIIVQQFPHGLFHIKHDSLSLVPGSEIFSGDNVGNMVPLDNGNILTITFSKGLFEYNGTVFSPFNNEINELLKKALTYKAVKLKSGNIAIATIQQGLFVIAQNGKLINRIHVEEKPTTELFEDDHGGLWAVLDGGLARVEIESHLSKFQNESGLTTTASSITRFQGEIYVGAYNGLFKLTQNGIEPAKFERVNNFANQIWALLPTKHGLLIGSQQGLFVLNNESISPIVNNLVTRTLYSSQNKPGTILVGSMLNFRTLEYSNGSWEISIPIEKIETNTHYIAEEPNGNIWLGSQFQGATKIEHLFDNQNRKITRYPSDEGFPDRDDQYVNTFYLDDHISLGTSKGIFRIDKNFDKIVPDSSFGELFAGPGKDVFRAEKAPDEVWFIRSSENGILQPISGSGYTWNDHPFRKITSGSTHDFYFDSENTAWLSTTNGVYRYDRNQTENFSHSKKTHLHKVSLIKDDSLLFGGHHNETVTSPELEHHQNEIRFQYGLPHFTNPELTQYSFRLLGSDDEWSPWIYESQKDYTNLRHGTYTFEVKAKDMYDNIALPASFSFTINPPWYQTLLAYLIYFVLGFGVFIGIILGAVRWNGNRLEVRNRDLELQVASRTKEIEEQKSVIEKSLEEKEILLKEIHHRVKNNLQIIYSLLNLQKESITDEKVLQAVKAGQGRIRSMSMVHEILYKNEDLKQVELSQYIRNLVEHIEESYQKAEESVTTSFDLEQCDVDLNVAIPLGLTVNEVVSNAFKHAFGETKKGVVKLKGVIEEGAFKLTISDNGSGIDPESKSDDTLGLLLIHDMIRQLKGKTELITTAGTSYTFNIPLSHE